MGDYVSPWMTEELSMLQDSAGRFFDREFVPHEEEWAKAGIMPREMWKKAGEAGLLLASVPEEYGGAGGTFAHESVILYEQGRANVRSLGNAVHSGIVAQYILAYGSEEQKRRWLPKMAAGELVGAIAMTEPSTGSDLQAVRTTARMTGNQYAVNGQKTFITNGQHADLVIVVAKTDPEEKARGVSLIVVETAEAEGFSRGRNLEKLGLKAQDTSELFFDDVKVPAANLLDTEEGQGFFQLMNQLPQERLIIGVGACAAMDLAIELTTDYVKQRKAFGKSHHGFPEHPLQAGRMQDRGTYRPGLRRQLPAAPSRRRSRCHDRRHGEMVVRPEAERGDRRVPATVRRLRLHGRIPDLAHVCRRPRAENLRRHQRDHEGTDRKVALDSSR